MNLKRISAIALALVLALSLSVPALAGAPALLIAPNPNAQGDRFAAEIFVNGAPVEEVTVISYDETTWEEIVKTTPIGQLPAAPAGYLPMRLLCGADPKGYADWIKEENTGIFALNGNGFYVDFSDLSVTVAGEKAEGVTAYLAKGVTFLPIDFLNTLEDVTVEMNEIDGSVWYEVTLAIDPVVALVKSLAENGEMFGQEVAPDEMEMLGYGPELCTSGAAQLPMMTSPDTVVVVKAAEGQEEELRAIMQEYIDAKKDTFSWYLVDNLPKVEDARIAEAGGWMMLYIGVNADQAVTIFEDGVVELNAALTGGIMPR